MTRLSAYFFGGFHLYIGERPLGNFATRKSKTLLAFLMLHSGQLFPREALAYAVWGEEFEADPRKAVRQELWTIRGALKEGGAEPDKFLTVQSDDVGFNGDAPCSLDVQRFEAALDAVKGGTANGLEPAQAGRLRAAVKLYRGDLLEGMYDDWCLYRREVLRDRHLAALEKLMLYHQDREEWDAAISYAKQSLAVDGLQENVHRNLMRFYYWKGNRAAALRQALRCKQLLRKELDVEPMAQTMAVYEKIRQEEMKLSPAGGVAKPAAAGRRGIERWFGLTERALRHLHSVRRELEDANQTVDGLIEDIEHYEHDRAVQG